MIALNELLAYPVEEVLTTPPLRQAVISYTRNLFYGGSPVSGCDSSVRAYFRRLQLFGLEQQKKLSNMKYQLKPGIFIVFEGQSYNSSTMTDAIAEAYLERFPKAIGNFIVNEDTPAADPAPAPVEKKPRAKKSK